MWRRLDFPKTGKPVRYRTPQPISIRRHLLTSLGYRSTSGRFERMFSSHFKWLNSGARRFSIRHTNTWRRSLCCGPVDSLANGARQYFKTRRPPDDDAQQKRAAAWYNNTTTTALSLKLSSQISSGMWRISGIWRTMMLGDDDQIKIMTLYGSSFVLFGTDGRSVECNQSVKFLHPLYFSSHCHHT